MTRSLSPQLFAGLPNFLAQPSQPATNTVTIVIGALLILAFIGLLVWLYTTNKLQHWFQAGTQSSKWRYQDMQLANESKKIERTKTQQIEDLGQKAWQARVTDPSYEQAWADLEAIETQINRIKDHSRTLQDQLNQVSLQHDDLTQNFDNQISQVEHQRKDTEAKLKGAQSELRQLESSIEGLANQKSSLQREIKATRSDLINTEGSDEHDREDILLNLNSRLDGLVSELLSVSNEEPELASQIPSRQSDVLTLNSRVNELGDQLRRLEGQKSQELEPITLQMEALEKQLRAKSDEIKDLERKMHPMRSSLGYQVDNTRPASDSLQENYAALDDTYRRLAETTQERTEIDAKMGEIDQSASRNFYLLILLGVIVLIVSILLITGVI